MLVDETKEERFIGDVIREAREKSGASQSEICRRSGICQSSLSMYEAHLNTPRMTAIKKIAEALDLPLSFFTQNVKGTAGEYILTPHPRGKGTPRVFTTEEGHLIRVGLEEGKTIVSLMKELGCGCETLIGYARENNLKRKRSRGSNTVSRRLDAIEEQIKLIYEIMEEKSGSKKN